MTISSTIAAESRLETFSATNVSVGDEFYMVAEIEIVSAENLIRFGMELFIDNILSSSYLTSGASGTSALEIPDGGIKIQIKSKPIIATTDSVLNRVYIRIPFHTLANANAVVKIGRVACYKI